MSVCMNKAGEALGCERNRFGANHFDVLETMIRKGGDINLLLAVSAQGVLVGLQDTSPASPDGNKY